MRKFLLSALFFCILCICKGQKPEAALEAWGQASPIEKVYLHFDRENYIAGETSWFKAYLASDYQPDTISTVLYVELLRDSATVISRKVLPVLFGATNGNFDLPDSLRSGTYIVRAWTPTQLGHDPAFIYKRLFHVFGKADENRYETSRKDIRIEFFPESGNFIAGLQNTMAVKVTDERGLPLDFIGKVIDSEGRQVAEIKTLHDGMGMFDITPSNQEYFAVSANEPEGRRYPLPVPVRSGLLLSTIPHPQGHFFEVRQNANDPSRKPAYMIGQMQHHLVFRKEFRNERDLSGLINTKHLRSGIMQVTVFTAEGLPLAERLCFINNREYIQQARLIRDTLNVAAKSRNRFTVQFKDTVQGSFSISVSDPDFEITGGREENIYSRFLLSSDLRGYIHHPAWYFTKDDEETKTALDLLMMTNGWRRFTWNRIPASTGSTLTDPGFIRLSGKVSLRDSKKPFDLKPLLLYIVGADSARNMMTTRTDATGRFMLDSLLFFGPARVMLSDPRGKKGLYISATFDTDSLHRYFSLPGSTATPLNRYELVARATQTRIAEDYDLIRTASGQMLAEVTVKTRKKSPLQELEERYASGMFSGMSEKTLDLTQDKSTVAYTNIFDYLQLRIPGLQVFSDGPEFFVYYRQGPTVSSMGEIPMTIFLNEVMTDASTLATIPANEIALVKVYSSFAGATGNGAGGAMAVYTKKGDDLLDASIGRSQNLRYNGFSVIKEFYSPDYQLQPGEKTKSDTRITLQWKPDIMVAGIDPKIPVVFYNNDRTKKFRVVVEGMTLEGKMLMIEEVLE